MTHEHDWIEAVVGGLPATHCKGCGRTDGLGGLVRDVFNDGVVIEKPSSGHHIRGFAGWFFFPMLEWSAYREGQGLYVLTSFFLLRAAWLSVSLAFIVGVLRAL